MAGEVTYQARQLFKDFLDVCQVRGRDSTGVIKVKKNQDYDWLKQVGPPVFLYDSKQYEKRIETGDALALIGHTRSKTSGDVSKEAAHPFDYPDEGVCGVHNGTLRGHHTLDTYHHSKVDSEVMYGHLAKNGPQETFNKLDGAWACVWWDNNDKTLNFIRNKERPLWFAWSDDMKMMFWASEPWMFNVISRKIKLWAGEEIEKEDGTKKWRGPYVELPTNQLWRFELLSAPTKDQRPMKLKPIIDIEQKSFKGNVYRGGHYTGGFCSTDEVNGDGWEWSNGAWHRPSSPAKGGEVTNPFQEARARMRERKAQAQAEIDKLLELNDPLPWDKDGKLLSRVPPSHQLSGPRASDSTPAGGTSSVISNVDFLKNSASGSGSTTPSKDSPSSERNILSLPTPNSKVCRQGSNGGPSLVTVPSSRKSSRSNTQKEGVSFRTVVGMTYITDNSTGKEYESDKFRDDTGGHCSFCKTPLVSLTNVGIILSDTAYVCQDCLSEPSAATA